MTAAFCLQIVQSLGNYMRVEIVCSVSRPKSKENDRFINVHDVGLVIAHVYRKLDEFLEGISTFFYFMAG